MKALRWFLFLVLAILLVGAFDWLLSFALFNIALLSWIWVAIIIFFGQGLLWGLSSLTLAPIMIAITKLPPNKNIAIYITTALILIAFGSNCYTYALFADAADFTVFGWVLFYLNMIGAWIAFSAGLFEMQEDAD